MKTEYIVKKMKNFMNRKEFLKKLRKNLSFLKKEELEKEILSYINKIDSSKLPDTEVIKSFGNMEDIVKEIASRHGLNYKSLKIHNSWFKNFYNELIELSTILKNSEGKKKGKILLDILLLIVITCILKIPFIFVRDLGDRCIENLLNSNLSFLAIWGLFIEIAYIIVALSFFIKTFKKWFKMINK